jgi:hypothetical protein
VAESKAIQKYLARHAEPEAGAADHLEGEFGHVLVVPAYGEGQCLFDLLGSVPRGPAGDTLIVVVLNARADSPAAAHEANRAARERLEASAGAARELGAEHPVAALSFANGRIVLLDRAREGHFLPEGQGVGLARKIGNDFALRLHAAGRVASPWIHNTDADTILPNDYFEQTETLKGEETGTALYFFEHRISDEETLGEAARLYEISLRYYVLGLAWAGSPYAYQSMGSCIAVRPWAYAEVRGFPKKNAAEDFYALNKLAKVGAIERLSGSPLLLEGRLSDRVPFGTGKALTQLVSKKKALSAFRLYHPSAFAHLSAWLRVLAAAAGTKGNFQAALEELPRGNPFFRSDLLIESLEKMGAFPALREAVERSPDAPTMLRHFHTWFDSFRTRKLVHALRDGGLASLPWREALAEAPFAAMAGSTVDDTEPIRKLLAVRERELAAGPTGVPALENV